MLSPSSKYLAYSKQNAKNCQALSADPQKSLFDIGSFADLIKRGEEEIIKRF
jgi:hypothetical protein